MKVLGIGESIIDRVIVVNNLKIGLYSFMSLRFPQIKHVQEIAKGFFQILSIDNKI